MSLWRLAALFLLCLAGPVPAVAQNYSSLYGRVTDTSEGGISAAAISVVNEDTGARRLAESEEDGSYAMASLPAGVYTVTVRKEGFRAAIRFGVRLDAGTPARADFSLPVGSMLESITVSGIAPMIERADASTGGQFESDEIERLPLNGGGLLSLLGMVPGANVTPATRGEAGQFTSNGQRPNANYFTVDGVSVNNGITAGGLPAQSTGGTLPALSAFGSMDSLISLDAVQEVRVQTSTTVAEFGRLPGASVALNSQAGANDFHGATVYRFRHELASANDWFANQANLGRAPLRLNSVAQTFGGPIARNRTFFFLSYEHMALLQPFVWTQPVPTLAVRATFANWAQAAVSLFPAPTGPALTNNVGIWTGHNAQPAALNTGGARLDQAITSRITLFGRYNDSPSNNTFGGIQINRLDLRSQSLTVGLNARPTANLSLDVRVNESQSLADSVWLQGGDAVSPECGLQPLTTAFLRSTQSCDYLVRLTINGIGQLESGREGERRQRQFQSLGAVTYRHGRHSLGAGVDFRRITAVRRDSTGTLAVIADQLTDLAGSRNVWVGTTPAVSQMAQVQELSLWLQDTWQATPRLTIASGLRWEFSPAPAPAATSYYVYDPATQELNTPAAGSALWPTSYRDFAPRLGIAWKLGSDGRTALRAGGGLYYDSSLSIATDILNGGPLNTETFTSNSHAPFSSALSYGFMPGLALPEVVQWNVSLEHAFSAAGVVSLGYVGSAGRGLIRRELGTPADSSTSLTALTNDDASSDYHALEIQYRRHFQGGIELQGSYTWSHSLDTDSSDSFLVWSASSDHASSDFDLRQSFTGSATFETPRRWGHLGGWTLSALGRSRTGFPITIQQQEEYIGISLVNAFRPNLVYGQPIWYGDPNSPGGRRLNPFAFRATASGQQGTLGRNTIAGFGMWQADLALSRQFRAGRRATVQLRIEAFNALNHASFADPVKYMDSPIFGQSSSLLNMELGTGSPGSGLSPILQSGGPRNFQASLRFHF